MDTLIKDKCQGSVTRHCVESHDPSGRRNHAILNTLRFESAAILLGAEVEAGGNASMLGNMRVLYSDHW